MCSSRHYPSSTRSGLLRDIFSLANLIILSYSPALPSAKLRHPAWQCYVRQPVRFSNILSQRPNIFPSRIDGSYTIARVRTLHYAYYCDNNYYCAVGRPKSPWTSKRILRAFRARIWEISSRCEVSAVSTSLGFSWKGY